MVCKERINDMEGMVDVNSMAPTNAVEGQGAQVSTAQVPQQGADL